MSEATSGQDESREMNAMNEGGQSDADAVAYAGRGDPGDLVDVEQLPPDDDPGDADVRPIGRDAAVALDRQSGARNGGGFDDPTITR